MVNLPATANPPHFLKLDRGTVTFTRIASHIYNLSLFTRDSRCHFLGRIDRKSEYLWAVTSINCQHCLPEYFDDWQQATLYIFSSMEFINRSTQL